MDEPLDFESEDPLVSSPVILKKRKKIIGLDDLLTDHYKEKGKVIERESKNAKSKRNYDSDEDDNGKEALLSKTINECHNQMKEMGGDEVNPTWGMHVFRNQKTLPPLVFPELGSCSLLQSFMSNELNSLVALTKEEGEAFFEGLLINGWLSQFIFTLGCIDNSIAKWALNLLLYSSNEELVESAFDFWCAILSPENKGETLTAVIESVLSYSELKRALETYGFQSNFSSRIEPVDTNCSSTGPPKNIRTWIKFVAACCHARSKQSIFSTLEAEDLVEIILSLSLDRRLQSLVTLLDQCMQSVINYFTNNEWNNSSERIVRSFSHSVPKDLNCLRAVECISGVTAHGSHLRSAMAYETLLVCFDNKPTNEEELLHLLMSINVKDKDCDLFKMYLYLILTENWFLFNPSLEGNPVVYEMWGVYLRNCSCQITSKDLRPYAPKVRNRASYLLDGTSKDVVKSTDSDTEHESVLKM